MGLVKVNHGPDYRHMVSFYENRVLPLRRQAAKTPPDEAMALKDRGNEQRIIARSIDQLG